MAIATAAVAALAIIAAPAGADAPEAHGYWWRLQSGVGPHLTPPGVPEGGLWVTDDPSGDQAVAALRFTGARASVLHLHVAEVTGTPTVVACPSASAWEPAEAGSWEDRPDASCDELLVTAELSDDATILTVPLTAFGDGPVDLVLVPDSTASGYFSISFDAPGDDAFEIITASTSPTTASVERPASSPVPTVAPRPEPVSYEPPPASFSTPIFEPPPEPSVTPSTIAPLPTPSPPTAPSTRSGSREPLAIVALLVVAVGWAYRGRAALRGAADHPLSAANVAFAREQDAS